MPLKNINDIMKYFNNYYHIVIISKDINTDPAIFWIDKHSQSIYTYCRGMGVFCRNDKTRPEVKTHFEKMLKDGAAIYAAGYR